MAKGFIKGALWGSCVSLSAVVLVSVFSSGLPRPPADPAGTAQTPPGSTPPATAPAETRDTAAAQPDATSVPEQSTTSKGAGADRTTLAAAGAPDTLDGLRESDMTPAAVPDAGSAAAVLQQDAASTTGTAPAAPRTDAPVAGAGQTAALTTPSTEPAVTVSTSSAAQPAEAPEAPSETTAAAPVVQTDIAALAPPVDPAEPRSAPEPDEGSISNLPMQPPAPDLPSERTAFTEAAPDTIAAADPAQPQPPAVLASGTAFDDSTRPVSDDAGPEVAEITAMAPATVQPDSDGGTAAQVYASTDTAPASVPEAQVAVTPEPEAGTPTREPDATGPEPEEAGPESRTAVRRPDPVTRDVAEDIADTSSQSAPPAQTAEPAPVVSAQNSLEGSFADRTDGVTTNRLPSLGDDEPEAEVAPADPQASGAADVSDAAGDPSASVSPLEQFARPAENPEGKPVMSIVLMDDGVDLAAAAIGLPALRRFPHPVTFAVEASLPDAASRAGAYRNEGFEVLAMINLPEGASATDAEVSVAAALAAVPEAVGVLEGPGTGVTTTPDAARQVSEILAASGHGLVTQNRGLNTAQKLAARAGVPSAVVFRDFDSEGQSPVVIRRFLDQAAFRAGQEGGIVMLGRLREDTVSALLVWALQDRADRVAMVPVSGALSVSE
ncbi:divergent polysaccharide deacetylase family protein [Roseobacter ponti]|uniref:Divergent polysaccharide deacetylase family protein n=1 Tax=Roseobacter ponti TaxID=1891787 RepID=A0A858SSM9_9RHOB|nr:divergent polysaccharide deacetylase family protein [Roseobacter ponti]QJF50928.1 divergent polysaccharide deacetylase family protein [Roseobacter ponti]